MTIGNIYFSIGRAQFAANAPNRALRWLFPLRQLRPPSSQQALVTTISAISLAAPAPFPGAVAVLAINGPAAARLKRHSRLLPASGTRDCRGL